MKKLVTIREAARIANDYLNNKIDIPRNISESNISYLLQYGHLRKYTDNDLTLVDPEELMQYYDAFYNERRLKWENELGEALNWNLSFEHLREKDTTKHVHRLHPYKGKFIPQLVEYFIDDHVDEFKKEVYFQEGDIVLDPFLGSGTTLVQANELGIHGIGVDISEFNCLITKCKIQDYDIKLLSTVVTRLWRRLEESEISKDVLAFERALLDEMCHYNAKHFPSPDFRYEVRQGQIEEDKYGKEKEEEFLPIYHSLVQKYDVEIKPTGGTKFLDKWLLRNIKKEIELVYEEILREPDEKIRSLMMVVLSRTVRSCRATRHYDLATLKEPQFETYYCRKHKKICKPIMTMMPRFKRYLNDTVRRIKEYNKVKTDAEFVIVGGDSRSIDIFDEVKRANRTLFDILKQKRARGIFSSPPYVGNIDYHDQHAYAYELFGFQRKDELEIGPLFKGEGKEAQQSYVEGISNVLVNCREVMTTDCDVFIVANDKHNLYPEIAKRADMTIVNEFRRPVLNRTERNRNPYSESIFHLKYNYKH